MVMSESIIVALITGALTLIGVLISNGKAQAVTETKLDALTKAVEKHNNFAQRLPLVEQKLEFIEGRVDDLEKEASK